MSGKASAASASINLLNTIIGAGMLAMPYGIKANGVVLGVWVIVFSACCSLFGLYLQGKCTRYAPLGHALFFLLLQLTYPQLLVVFDLAIAVKCFGVGILYLVVVGDLVPKVVASLASKAALESHPWLLHRNVWIALLAVVVVPLLCLKKLDSLRYALMVALSLVAYLAVLVVVHFLRHDVPESGPVRVWKPYLVLTMLGAFPIFVFAYTCHQNMFSLVNELKDKLPRNINRVIVGAIGTAVLLYVVVGVSGYITFGDLVGGNIIVLYPQSFSSTFGRAAIVVLVVLSFPLQCHPCRASINHVLHYAKQYGSEAPLRQPSTENLPLIEEGQEAPSEHAAPVVVISPKAFWAITATIVTCSYLVAFLVLLLEHVLAFVGSTGSTSILFILPGLFGYTLIGSEKDPAHLTLKERLQKYGGLALAMWGVVVMVVCLSATIFLGATH